MIRIIETNDGSHSLYREDLDETYHSRHGALAESNHVFLENGLSYWIDNQVCPAKISVLEIGFGTGLNAALTLQFCHSAKIPISYITLEPFPLDLAMIGQLNYFDGEPRLKHDFAKLHEAPWEMEQCFGDFSFFKSRQKIEDFFADIQFDVIYYDAFAPEKQPELWEMDIFIKLYGLMASGGIMTTYCAKGEFKRNLKKVGFEVFTLPGPVRGKREMVRAVKR